MEHIGAVETRLTNQKFPLNINAWNTLEHITMPDRIRAQKGPWFGPALAGLAIYDGKEQLTGWQRAAV